MRTAILFFVAAVVSFGQGTASHPGGGGGSGTVTNLATGCGLSGGPVTATGTISASVLPDLQTGSSPYAIPTGDCGKLISRNQASAVLDTIAAAGSTGFPLGWYTDYQCRGAGGCTITPATSTIDGAATLVLGSGQGVRIVSDGANYATQRGASPVTGVLPVSNLPVLHGQCTEAWGGSGTSFALTSGDDAISNNTCYNDSGATRTITAIKCRSDAASNSVTLNPSFGAAGTGTSILAGAVTCGNSYAYSATGTLDTGAHIAWTTGTGIDPVMAGTLTGSTSIALLIEYTYQPY
jgi:hypothetical protein